MRNAERGTTLLRCATQTRKKLIDYICIYPTFFGLCSLDAIRDKGETTKGCCTYVLRPEGVLPLTKYCAKIQSPNRREFTQAVNDRMDFFVFLTRSPKGAVFILRRHVPHQTHLRLRGIHHRFYRSFHHVRQMPIEL